MIHVHILMTIFCNLDLKCKYVGLYINKYLCEYIFNVSFNFWKFPVPIQRIVLNIRIYPMSGVLMG
jgi:hypothetical protein